MEDNKLSDKITELKRACKGGDINGKEQYQQLEQNVTPKPLI